MNIIVENPYRTLGVFGGASTREIEKQKNAIKRYAEIGKQKIFPTDFSFLGNVHRNTESIVEAANRIEQSKNKVVYALFWFLNLNHIDDTAINYLTKGEIEKAISIWRKLLTDYAPIEKNYSAFLNLSTLLIQIGFKNNNIDYLLEGIEIKGKAISSSYFGGFVKNIAGDNIILSNEVIANEFSKEVLDALENSSIEVEFGQLLSAFATFPLNVSEKIKKQYTEKPFQKIETAINNTKVRRERDPASACRIGTSLLASTKADLLFLNKTLGKNNLHVKSLTDNLANEMLQCSIDYFNEHRELEDIDPGDETLKLIRLAKSIVSNGTVLNRINENLPTIEKWVDDAPEREKYKKVGEDIEDLVRTLEKFLKSANSIANVTSLLADSKTRLARLLNTLGSADKNYSDLSNAIAGNAMGMLIQIINSEQESTRVQMSPVSIYETVVKVRSLMDEIGKLKMFPEVRSRFNENKIGINNLFTQISRLRTQATSSRTTYSSNTNSTSSSSSSSSSGGCYIATMAYGDYDHPQVMELRAFRDNVLAQTYLGRAFIRFYYALSPKLVTVLKNHERINKYIRKQLDKFIESLK